MNEEFKVKHALVAGAIGLSALGGGAYVYNKSIEPKEMHQL